MGIRQDSQRVLVIGMGWIERNRVGRKMRANGVVCCRLFGERKLEGG